MTDAGGETGARGTGRATIKPAPGAWTPLETTDDSGALGELRRSLRAEIGLPTDRPVIMTGHQCGWWHAGVLAKYMALRPAADALGAHAVRLWVDQDTNDPAELRYPSRADRDAGGIADATWRLVEGLQVAPETPTGMRDPIRVGDTPENAHEAVRPGALDAIRDAMHDAASESTLARQTARAIRHLAPRWVGEDDATDIFALELARTAAFGELVDRMDADPASCARAYNDAAESHPGAGIRPLTLRDGRVELPLWRVRRGEPRLPVYASQLASIPRAQLAPRALLMTGLVRLAACDLFIHGTGGGAYAPVTEAWLTRWLGGWLGGDPGAREAALLAPVVTVTATATLVDADADVPSPEDAAEAKARAHKARHDPSLVGDKQAAAAKAELIRRIDDAKEQGRKPGPLFGEMQRLLEDYRARHADAIAQLDADAERLDEASRASALLLDRTWAFPLLPEERLEAIAGEIARAVGDPTATPSSGAST